MRPSVNNDPQNIERAYTKMSDHFPSEDTKLSNLVESATNFTKEIVEQKGAPLGHMYTSENGELNLSDIDNCQNAESEVKFWKEWLILHLDLIQQQSDEILSKERTILILQQENEMLKERLNCMERGAPFQPAKFCNHLDMTQGAVPCQGDHKTFIELVNGDKHSDGESQAGHLNVSEKLKGENEVAECDSSSGFNFTVSNSGEFDPMRNLKMNIRRKRLSNSSATSNNDCAGDEKRSFRRFRKRRKRVVKDSQIVSTIEQYITEASEAHLRASADLALDVSRDANLEVPRWRVKVYASCYAMEGTENLDDEVYNKRHSRLENDERRRKRWDVQRIREQRLVEKLKQRQERLGSGSRSDEQMEPIVSLWPKIEDIKFLEVTEQLPVSAFGCPIPKLTPSEFSLPWLNNPSLITAKKIPNRKSTARRKTVRR